MDRGHAGCRWIVAACAAAAVAGVDVPPARADACPGDVRASFARVQLFRDGACRGASVSVGFAGIGDRPDFEAFTNSDGVVYDVDDTRDSLAVAPATCVRLFDRKGYTGMASGLLCDGQFSDLGAMTNEASSMRVCPVSATGGCDARPAPPPPPPSAAPEARLTATPARHTIAFGKAAFVRVRLTDTAGQAIAGAALQVSTRAQRTGARRRPAPAVTTGADGRAIVLLAPGPSRSMRVQYGAAAAQVRLNVRAGVTLRIAPRLVSAGRSIHLRGRLLAAPATRLGKLVTFQARERGRWREFGSARTRRDGRFTGRYRFSRGASGRFPIRVVARAEASYPYATGRSRAVAVRVVRR